VDDSLYVDARRAREDVKGGILRGPALVERLLSVPYPDRDVWTDELLALPEPPPDIAGLPVGAVPYLPAGVEEILTMVLETPLRPDEQFVDLGSGMGRVAILAHLLSGARASGVEIQKPLVDCARKCCDGLGLNDISFVHANAADTELDGEVFFLYSPFNGETLTRVLSRLECVARRRAIAVCTVGLELPGEGWLRARRASSLSMTFYDSQWPDVPRAPVRPKDASRGEPSPL
jgi:SAM-dependent methyltransferase